VSVQAARTFVEKMFKDKAFYEKIHQIPTEQGKMKAAKEAGFDFTKQDMEKLLPKGVSLDQLRHLKPGQEVPDEVLEAVAGGKNQAEEIAIDISIDIGVELVVAVAAAAI
jgi:predicted ribosomally synthesized peptide with nif11-like leader